MEESSGEWELPGMSPYPRRRPVVSVGGGERGAAMWVRANHVSGVSDIDAGVAMLRDKVLPTCSEQKGFKGMTASANRAAGRMGVLTLWETKADLEASESAVAKQRSETVAETGGTVKVSVMEQLAEGIGSSFPEVGNTVVVTELKVEPSTIDDQVKFFTSTVMPDLKSQPGFRACRLMVDRTTGEGIVGAVWTDDAVAHDGDEQAAARRQRAKERGVELGEPDFRELVFVHMQ
ncbi:MAG: hypothetical protein NVS3B12_31150 [Acidimicrobiales bacterium]